MKIVYIREQKRYSLQELCILFNQSESKTIQILKKLKEIGIVKTVHQTKRQSIIDDLSEEDNILTEIISKNNTFNFVFSFVGTISIKGIIIHCYPKYIKSNDKPIEEYKQILKVLEKFFNRRQNINLFFPNDNPNSYNLLSLYLFLIEDYFNSGIYTKEEHITEINGSGDIDWNKTINRDSTIIKDNTPYYIDLVTKNRKSDKTNYIRRLHECILTLISKDMKESGLLNLFDLTEINLSNENLSDFGDTNYILNRLDKELNEEFNTRKQQLLSALITFISNNKYFTDFNCITFYGTNSFNLVWEHVCASVLDNQLKLPLRQLNLPKPLTSLYNPNDTLLDLIEKPFWSITEKLASDTFIPDIVSIREKNGKYFFIIYDAKYYVPILNPGRTPTEQPGIESISKQFFYQLAFNSFIKDHDFNYITNCFILPTEKDEIIDKEYVFMEIMRNVDLQNIEVKLLPAQKMFEYYLRNKKIDLD